MQVVLAMGGIKGSLPAVADPGGSLVAAVAGV